MTAILLLVSYVIFEMNYDKDLDKYQKQVKKNKSAHLK